VLLVEEERYSGKPYQESEDPIETNWRNSPLVTPLDDTGQLDRQGLRHLIEYVISGGVDGIFVAGTTGG
jgi:hypothetical protein